ncbi:MAG: amino acid--tRNA ligase-related protein [Sphaerochaetaceae bacterium]
MYDFAIAKKRNELYKNIREFFDDKGYLEVDTPSLSDNLIPENSIENFSTMFSNEFLLSKEFYLIPSPEVFMKKLFVQEDCPSIYQISKCFRNSEQLGKIHNPEFSMLEYYTKGFDEKDSII